MTLLEGYIGNWRKYPTDEVKIRVARPSVLGPSKELLLAYRNKNLSWKEFEVRFRAEISAKPEAISKLQEIKKLAQTKNVRLLCYEKTPPCHRFILIEMIQGLREKE